MKAHIELETQILVIKWLHLDSWTTAKKNELGNKKVF